MNCLPLMDEYALFLWRPIVCLNGPECDTIIKNHNKKKILLDVISRDKETFLSLKEMQMQ